MKNPPITSLWLCFDPSTHYKFLYTRTVWATLSLVTSTLGLLYANINNLDWDFIQQGSATKIEIHPHLETQQTYQCKESLFDYVGT